jgi:hypothetical protein
MGLNASAPGGTTMGLQCEHLLIQTEYYQGSTLRQLGPLNQKPLSQGANPEDITPPVIRRGLSF